MGLTSKCPVRDMECSRGSALNAGMGQIKVQGRQAARTDSSASLGASFLLSRRATPGPGSSPCGSAAYLNAKQQQEPNGLHQQPAGLPSPASLLPAPPAAVLEGLSAPVHAHTLSGPARRSQGRGCTKVVCAGCSLGRGQEMGCHAGVRGLGCHCPVF